MCWYVMKPISKIAVWCKADATQNASVSSDARIVLEDAAQEMGLGRIWSDYRSQ